MSRQLDRLEQKVDELTARIGSMAWYYEETLDQLAFIDQRLEAIEMNLGIGTFEDKEDPPVEEWKDPGVGPFDTQ
jgi:hypothetical protein